jgi:hypothetical protein
MNQRFSILLRPLVCSFIVLCFAIIANAQFKAGIQGSVSDSAGAVIPSATVTLTNKETGLIQQTATSDNGFYRFSGLAPGNYSISFEKENFKKTVVDNVKVDAESVKGVDGQLEIGGISEVVTVESTNAPLETEDANIRKTITTDEVLKLPQAGRDPYELARLAPGVFGTGARGAGGGSVGLPNTSGPGGSNNSIFATENVQPITANGQRVSANNYQIDGTSVNSQTWGGGAVITPSQESVKEVQVTSSTFSAEDGRNSGAQIKVVTQNGTNQLHGSAFYKYNDPSLNAFNKMPSTIGTFNTTGPQRVERKFNSYGGSVGGRVVRDKLFFFFAYEGLRENTSNTYNSLIETAQFRQQVLGARAGTVTAGLLSMTGIEPRVSQILPSTCDGIFVPCQVVGNGMDLGSLVGTYGTYVQTFNNPTYIFDGVPDVQWAQLNNFSEFRGNQYNTRIDYQATDKDKFTFSSYFVPNQATNSNGASQSRPSSDVNSKRLSYAVGFIYNRTISSTMINEARFNITRWGFNEIESNPIANLGLPRIEIEGVFSDRLRIGFPQGLNTPGNIDEKQLDFNDTLTNVIGNHVLKIGGGYRRDLNSNGEIGGARPLYSFRNIWNFANGTPIFEFIAADLQGKPAPNNTKFTTSELAFFAQDDWKLRPNLTVNIGLRWSYYSPVTSSNGVLGNLLLDSNNGLAGAKITTDEQLYKRDYNNFGPQLGFAWSPEKFNTKLVVRGGYGLGFDRLPNALLANARRNPPNGALFNICCGTNGTTDGFGTPFVDGQISYVRSSDGTILGYPANPNIGGGANPANGLPINGAVEIYGSPQDLPTAYVMRYSLEGQYELPNNLVATVGYQGSQGRHFVRILPLHIMTTRNPNISAAYFASPDVNTSYNAMIARLQGRFFKQFSFDMNYRFAKSLDTVSFESPCACTNQSFPVDQKQERGPSDFDVKHSFVMSGIWELPIGKGPMIDGQGLTKNFFLGGWQISNVFTYNTGFPWTPKLFGCLDGAMMGSSNFCDPRPTGYDGTQPLANTNANFLQPGGLFPNNLIRNANGDVIGSNYFTTSFNTNNPFANPPGIGRNSFRGPRYLALDMSFIKRFELGGAGFLGENVAIDLKANFFNILNTLNLAPFNSNTDSTRITLNQFATATSGLAGRVGEFQVRFSF